MTHEQGVMETIGARLAAPAVSKSLDAFIQEARGYEIDIIGRENLESLCNSGYVIACNHIGEAGNEGGATQASGFTPDVVVLETAVKQATGKTPLITAGYNDEMAQGIADKMPKLLKKIISIDGLQNYVLTPLQRGVLIGLGMIPINKISTRRYGDNDQFYHDAAQEVLQGEAVVIFAEGKWRRPEYRYAESGAKIKDGAGILAQKSEKPIVPTYIKCGEKFVKGMKAKVVFGRPIYTNGMDRKEIRKQIEAQLIEMEKQAN